MEAEEYLASFGQTGEFGRFRSSGPLACRRGERVVVRSHRGLEVAEVLREATPRHAHFLPNTSVGQLLRRLGPEDEAAAERARLLGQRLFERGQCLAAELGLPLELIDVDVLLDGRHAVLHHLRGGECDVRPFVSTLSREHDLHLTLEEVGRPRGTPEDAGEEDHGCGREGCGRAAGGCGTCGSGGGCATCGAARPPGEEQAHFARLREQMERRRTALL
jgi:hypothetical protein